MVNKISIFLYNKHKLILIFIVVLVFSNTLVNGYNLDDNLVTRNHPFSSQGLAGIKQIFSQPYYSDNMGYSYGYRPIVHVSFAIENELFGEHVFVSHLFNLIFYCVSVILLFTLLKKWIGEANIGIAFIASILFAVHPIHSEVVASIKNRDEILAFLFMLLTALAIYRYLNKDLFYSLISIPIFFTLGMLSKKSIFPMALFLPIVSFYLYKISIKKIALISLLLVIPSTIIAADFKVFESFQLVLIQLVGLFLFYFLKNNFNFISLHFKLFIKSLHPILLSISWILIFCFISFNNPFILLFSFILSIYCLFKQTSFSIIHVILQCAIIGFVKGEYDFKVLSILLLLDYYHSVFIKGKKEWLIYLLGAFLTVLFLIFNNSTGDILLLLTILLFFYLLQNKLLWSILLSIAAMFISILFFQFSIFSLLLLLISLFKLVEKYKSIYLILLYRPIIIVSIILIHTFLFSSNVFFNFKANINNSVNINKPAIFIPITDHKVISSNITKEGRDLQFVENTLVLPHPFSVTIGTGLVTIGSYLKLLFWPLELSFYYGYAVMNNFNLLDIQALSYLLIFLCIIILGFISFKKHPFILIGFLWFSISIFLFSNIVELVAGMIGERLAFNASAGFCLFISASFYYLKSAFSNKHFKFFKLFFAIFIVFLSVRTIIRNADWKDPLTLMRKDITHLNQSAQAHNLLALNLMEVSTSDKLLDSATIFNLQQEAILHFKFATQVYPYFFNAWYDLGRVYVLKNNNIQAKLAFEKAYTIDRSSLLVLEELVKTSFDLKLVDNVEFYATSYIKKNQYNENIHELLSYIMYLNNEYKKSSYYAKNGLQYFPNNKNLQLILSYSINK